MAKLCLGTVQLGMDYGISNQNGRPSEKEAFELINTAVEAGVDMVDTGPMYGSSEEIIGRYVKKCGCAFNICTKLSDVIPNGGNIEEKVIEDMLKNSLRRLNVPYIYGYYLHQFYQCKSQALMQVLAEIKRKGFIQNIGISIYYPDELIYICENLSGSVDIVQIPYNVFSIAIWDKALKLAKRSGIKIFCRSIFLQGLVFLNKDSNFVKNIGAVKYLQFVSYLAQKRGQDIHQLCYDVVVDSPYIEYLVIGCENIYQLNSNLKLEKKHREVTSAEIQEIIHVMADIPKDILDPTTWNKYKTTEVQ